METTENELIGEHEAQSVSEPEQSEPAAPEQDEPAAPDASATPDEPTAPEPAAPDASAAADEPATPEPATPAAPTMEELTANLRERTRIVDEAVKLSRAHPYDPEAYDALERQWAELPTWDHPRIRDLEGQWHQAIERNARARVNHERLTKSKEVKEELIREARQIKDSTDWRATATRMEELMASWKEAGFSGTADNDRLWEEFRGARKEFFDRRNQHYEELREKRKEVRAAKEGLIVRAREILESVTNWKQSTALMDEVFDQWKKAGSAGRDDDQRLWTEFNAIRGEFYEGKRAFNLERKERLEQSAQTKQALIDEARAYADSGDFSKEALARMRAMSADWKEAGFSGKDNDRLWKDFRAAQDAYWEARSVNRTERYEQWRQRTEDAIARRRTRIERLKENMRRNEERMTHATTVERIDEIDGWIDEDRDRIASLEAEISKMESELEKDQR